MREILFRGKSMNGGEWVEGSLRITTHQPTNDTPFKCYEIEDTTYGEFPDDFMSGICEEVDPETVGQFTGLTDKNGKKIFEGDIVTTGYGLLWTIAFDLNAFVALDGKKVQFALFEQYRWDRKTGSPIAPAYFEVIGNIHDNSELLEGA